MLGASKVVLSISTSRVVAGGTVERYFFFFLLTGERKVWSLESGESKRASPESLGVYRAFSP